METTKLDETRRKLKMKTVEVRYYLTLAALIVAGVAIGITSVIYSVQKDNDKTRHLICEIAQRVQLTVKDCP